MFLPEWSTGCPDWVERIVDRRSLIPFAPLYADEGAQALRVFKSLKVTDLPGQPTFGEVCEQWVFDFVEAIFGAYDHETATRRIREFFLLISKKNGKSTIAAGIMVTALIRNWRHYAELLILAPTLEIANNSFKPAAAMVRADDELAALMHIQDHLRQITHRVTHATLTVIAAVSSTVGGKKGAFILIDELWLFGERADAESMLQEALGGLASRDEGFVIYLSTQSDKAPAGVFKAKLDYARGVRDGRIDDPAFLAVIYEFPPKMVKSRAYEKPENFYITNPNLGRSVNVDWLVREMAKAMIGSGKQSFLAKHLNIEIGTALASNRWAGADHWDGAVDETLRGDNHVERLRKIIERSEVVVLGLDGGGLDDLYGLSALGREPPEFDIQIVSDGVNKTIRMKRWIGTSHAWCDRGVLALRQSIAPRLLDFEEAGELTIVDDALSDIGEIVDLVGMVKDAGVLGGVLADPAGLGDLVDALAEIDVTTENGLLIGAPQGIGMMNAIKTSERRLKSGMLRHSGGGLMRWAAGNLKIEPTATAIRATKQSAGDAKIDPIMAMFNAVTQMVRNPKSSPAFDVDGMLG